VKDLRGLPTFGLGGFWAVLLASACLAQEPAAVPSPLVIGPFQLQCRPIASGRSLDCFGKLGAVPTIAHTLLPTKPGYEFDVLTANATAKGKITAVFMPPDQLSTIDAEVTVTSKGQEPVPYRGAFMFWMAGGNRGR
jgi:hypothetical protein